MRKIYLYFILSFLAVFSLTGCYPTGDKTVNQDSISDYVGNIDGSQDSNLSKETASASEASGNIELDLENVRVSLTLPEYNTDSFKEIRVNRKEFDADALVNIFLGDEQDISLQESESSFTDGFMRQFYETEDEKRVSCEPGYASYDDSRPSRDYSYSLVYSATFSYDMEETFSSVEFDDFSIDEARNTVETYLEKMGIDNYGSPNVYSITAEGANKYFDSFGPIVDKHGNPLKKWTEEQQCYILIYPIEYNGIEFSIAREVGITAIITKNDLLELSCDDVIDSSTIVEEEGIDVQYDAEQALNMVIDKYERMIIDNPVNIIDCKLSYITTEGSKTISQTYVPVWEFTLKSEYADSGTRISHNYVDVQSGEIY